MKLVLRLLFLLPLLAALPRARARRTFPEPGREPSISRDRVFPSRST